MAWRHVEWTITHWKCVMQSNQSSRSFFFWKEMGVMCSRPKIKRTIQTVNSNEIKSQVVVQGCFTGLAKGQLYFPLQFPFTFNWKKEKENLS